MVGTAVSAASSLDLTGAQGVLFDLIARLVLLVTGIKLRGHGLTIATFVYFDGGLVHILESRVG